jgi:integrase
MKEKDMAQVEGLNLRGSRWYVRILVPNDLKAAYGTSRMNIALDTSERPQAVLRATLKRSEWLTAFEAKRRQLNPVVLEKVTSEMSAELAQRVRRAVLREDDRLRSDLPLLAEMVHIREELDKRNANPAHVLSLTPPERKGDSLEGLREKEAFELASLNEYLSKTSAINLSRRNLITVLPLVQAEAVSLGFTFNPATLGAREALQASLQAYRTALHEVTLRDAGEVIETPVVSATGPTSTKPRTLRDVYDRWITSGDSQRALVLYETFAPDKPLSAITREQGDTFRGWLREKSAAAKTARSRFTYLKSLLKYAADTLEWIPKHPWAGLAIDAPTASPRRPWSAAELSLAFSTPLHTAHALPLTWHSGADAAYWIPLIGLYSGARLGELCQLRSVDVSEEEGIAVMVLTSDGENQSIKSDAGHRTVPIHSELIRLGFLDYAAAIKATGSASLWPALKLRKGKPSGFFSRWFSEFRKGVGLLDKYPDFHCFRHTVRPLMRRAGHSESTMDKITGHATGGSQGTVTYDHWTLRECQQAVEAIRYPALKIPKVAR